MRRGFVLVLLLGSAMVAGAQQFPSADSSADAAVKNAVSQKIQAAESALEKRDYRAAETLLRALAHDHPKDAHILYDLGFAQEANGEIPDAAENYQAAIQAQPEYPEALLALGLLEARENHAEAARLHLATVGAMTSAPAQLRARALRALASLNVTENPAQASAQLLQAIQLTSEQPDDLLTAGEAALRSGEYAAAETAFAKAIASDSNDTGARVGLAKALRGEKKNVEAEQTLVAALHDHPTETQVIAELAALYASEGKDAEAMSAIEQLRVASPAAAQNEAITSMLARLYAMNHREADAEPLYRALLARHPDDPSLLDAFGGVLLRQARYTESMQVLLKAVGMRTAFHDDKAWGEAESHLAFAAMRNHQPQVALQALAARSTVLPNSPASLFLEATAHDALHQYKDAERLYRAFLAAAAGKFPDEEFETRHRLVALDHAK